MAAPGALTWGGLLGLLHLAGVLCSGADAPLQVQPQVHPQGNLQVRPHGDAQVEPQVEPQVDGRDRLKVRLVNGSSRCVGRVEVLHRDRWGSVCDDTWDMADAQVICRSLGCGSALAAPGHAHFGQGAGPIWLDGTHCTGEEPTLGRCRLHTWGQHDCGHGEDAGAVCSGADPPQVRLRGGAGPCSGQVQVLLNRTWLQVCGLTWGLPEAQVLCRQLGCGPALSAPAGPHLQQTHLGEPHLGEPHLQQTHLGEPPHLAQPHLLEQPHLWEQPHLAQPHLEQPHLSEQPHLEQPHLSEPHLEQPHLAQPHLWEQGPHLSEGPPYLSGLTCDGSESHLAECLREGAGPGTCAGGAAAELRCERPKGAAPSCSYLVALLLLLTSLGGALLWLTLRARCVPAHLDAPRAPGAVYLPGRSSPGQGEELQLMDDTP